MMDDNETRVDQLLKSIVGSAFVVALDATRLSLADIGDPKTALQLAAASADFAFSYNANHDLVAPELLALARG